MKRLKFDLVLNNGKIVIKPKSKSFFEDNNEINYLSYIYSLKNDKLDFNPQYILYYNSDDERINHLKNIIKGNNIFQKGNNNKFKFLLIKIEDNNNINNNNNIPNNDNLTTIQNNNTDFLNNNNSEGNQNHIFNNNSNNRNEKNLLDELNNKNMIIEQQHLTIINLQKQLNNLNNLYSNNLSLIQNLQNNLNQKEQELQQLKLS